MFRGDFPAGDGEVTSQPRFAGQQVVVRGVMPAFGNVVADEKQPAVGIVQKAQVDRFNQCLQIPREFCAQSDHLSGEPLRNGNGLAQAVQPFQKRWIRIAEILADRWKGGQARYVSFGKIGQAR